jgi:hypothetical protein
MTTGNLSRSAKIYQFPVGGRAALSSHETKPAADMAPPHIVFGSGWYHEEAVQDAEKARKN